MNQYDVIVVGAGNAALAAAVSVSPGATPGRGLYGVRAGIPGGMMLPAGIRVTPAMLPAAAQASR